MKDWSLKISEPWNRVYKHPSGYLDGCVITANGIVYAYSQGGVRDGIKDANYTIMQVVHEGSVYTRTVDKRYSVRGLATVCNRFAKEVADGQA